MTLMFLFVLGIGCVAGSVVRPTITAAQSNPAASIYQDCISATLYTETGRSVNNGGSLPHPVRIPVSYYVVGGGANIQGGLVVLCR
jgi:hypothetical protein